MTYPNILLTHPIRRALMIGLMALFGLLAPAVILYSAGYRYDQNTKRVKVTGVISIEAEPEDALVTINNIRINKRLPLKLTNRAPGRYQLRLEKTGFKPWEKEILVEEKQTTYIKNISLLRDQLPVPVEWALHDSSSLQFSGSPDGRYALGSVIESGIETITLFDTETAKSVVISRRATTEPSLFSWSPGGTALLLAVKNKPGWRLTMISLSDPNHTASYRQEEARAPRWQWSQNSDTIMFAPDGRRVIGLNLEGFATVATLATDTIWFVTGERAVWTPLAEPGAITETIRLKSIVDINRERIIGRTDNDLVVIKRSELPDQIQVLPAQNVRHNPATKEWLAWSTFELWTIYENGAVGLLNRASDRIRAVEPLDENGVLLVVSDRGLNAFNPGYSVAHDLFLGRIESASVNQKQRLIYFLGEVGGKRKVFQLEY